MTAYTMIDVADEIRRLLSELHEHGPDEAYDRRVLAFRCKFPGLTDAQLHYAMEIAKDEQLGRLERELDAEYENFETWLDTFPKRPEALQELAELDYKAPLRKFLAKRGEQQ